jgi:hypothetical protein
MKKRAFLTTLGAAVVTGASLSGLAARDVIAAETTQAAPRRQLQPGQIQHMVIFDLKHDRESQEALTFLRDGRRILTAIPGVRQFQVFKQVSPKNDYDFGFSMVFADKADFEKYNSHPDHVAFVEQRWKKEVSRFLEIDFEAQPT